MSQPDRETEVKFYVRDLTKYIPRLLNLHASLTRDRSYEINLRFDTAKGDLRRAHQVLRLRRDKTTHLTFKGPGQIADGVISRQEIEVGVDDFDSARRIIETLGYQVVFTYEKFRSIYSLDNLQIMLDELPYGNFIELEGEDADIRKVASDLGLKWEAAIVNSYHALFERPQAALHLTFRDLTFANFNGLTISPDILGVKPAD